MTTKRAHPRVKISDRKVPDIKPKPRTKGRRHRLGIRAFWAALFEENEFRPKAKKMTDAKIKEEVQREYPDSAGAKSLGPPGEAGQVSVNYYRTLYNKGKLTRTDEPPTRKSYRYNLEGIRVDGRTGRRPLESDEIE